MWKKFTSRHDRNSVAHGHLQAMSGKEAHIMTKRIYPARILQRRTLKSGDISIVCPNCNKRLKCKKTTYARGNPYKYSGTCQHCGFEADLQ
jgi:predicted RNA-binding Zn-ribbon protein involved in translation (DUF1610 family)